MVTEFCQPVIPLALFHDNPKRERCRCHWSHMMPGEGSGPLQSGISLTFNHGR